MGREKTKKPVKKIPLEGPAKAVVPERAGRPGKSDTALPGHKGLFHLLDEFPGFVYLQDPHHRIHYANRYFRENFGDGVGRFCHEIFRNSSEPCPECNPERARREQRTIEHEWTTPDGKVFQIYSYPFKDAKGLPFVLEMGMEITERKRAAERLHLFRTLLDRSNDAIFVLDAGTGAILDANEKASLSLGYGREELLRMKTGDIDPGMANPNHWEEGVRRMREAGHLRREARYRRKDGIIFPVEVNSSYAEHEKEHFVVSVVRDITERKEAERALIESEEKFRAFAAAATDAIIHLNSEGKIVYWNRSAEKMFGYGFEEVRNRDLHLVLAPKKYHGLYVDGFRNFRASGEGPLVGNTIEIQAMRKDGSEFAIEASISSIRINNEWHAVGIIRDISGRKAADKALREANQLMERVFSTMHMLIAYMDRDFNLIKVNRAYAEADQREPDFFRGKNHFDLYPNTENEAIFRKVVEAGEPYFAFEKPFEYAANPERGATYWDWSLVPIKEPDGSVTGLLLTLIEVTDRKRAEDALWESERKYRGIFDSTFQFTGLVTPEGNVVEINRAALDFAGVGPSDVVNRPFWETAWWQVSEEARERLKKAIIEAGEGKFVRYESEILGAGGRTATIDFSLKPMLDYSGKVSHLIPEGRDISERKEMEAELSRNAARAKALDEVSRAFAETGLEVQGIMETVVGFMAELIGDSALIRLLSEDGTVFREFVLKHKDPIAAGPFRDVLERPQSAREGLHGIVASSGKPLLIKDVSESGASSLIGPDFLPFINLLKVKSLAVVPLRYEGSVLGILCMSRHEPGPSYTEEDLLFLQEIADRAALAISNARLYQAVQDELGEKRRLEGLMKEREFISAVLNTMGHLVIVLDNEGRVVSFNKACEKLSGYKAEELKGKYFWDHLVPPGELAGIEAAFRRLAGGDYPLIFENNWKTRDGKLRMTSWSNTVLLDENGEVKFVIGTGLDITEKRLAEEEREHILNELVSYKEHLEELVKERTRDLADRINQIKCLYSVSDLLGREDISLEERFQHIAELLPAACRRPEMICARVNIAGAQFDSEEFCAGPASCGSDITVSGRKAGFIQLSYIQFSGGRAPEGELFTREERELLDAAAKRIGLTLERKYSEEALREREERLSLFRALIEQSNDAVFVTDPATGRFLDVNERACKDMGYSRQEMLALRVPDIVIAFSDPEVWDRQVDELRNKGYLIIEGRQKRKDGSTFPVEANVKHILHDQREYIVAVVRDITERKEAEEELARLVAAVESTAEGVVITDPEGAIMYVNPAFEQITGYSRADAAGKYFYTLDGQDPDAGTGGGPYQGIWKKLRAGKMWSGRLESIKKDGTPYQEEVTMAPVRSPSGEITNYVAVKRDITEKLRLESVAEAVNTMNNIGYIFSGIRHEIGNPVNSMKTALSVLRGKLDSASTDTVREYIDRAMAEVSRLEYLLKALKNFNMYETPDLKKIQIDPFIRIFMSLTAGDFEKKGIRLELDISPQVEYAYADPRALQQVLLNIMTNAGDALEGRPEPKIMITIMRMGNTVLIRVSDNGCGISEKQQKELFMPFYTTKAHGTGLGLMIARKMLSRMNGNLQISSELAVGTTVDIFLREEPGEDR